MIAPNGARTASASGSRRAREAACWTDPDWRTARVLDYLRLMRGAGS